MQPLIVAQQVTQGVSDFLRTAFPSTTPGFVGLLDRFLAQRENLFKGAYLTVPLPFRAGATRHKPYPWLANSFIPHAHQAKAFARLDGADAQSTLIATGTGSGKTECFIYSILEHCHTSVRHAANPRKASRAGRRIPRGWCAAVSMSAARGIRPTSATTALLRCAIANLDRKLEQPEPERHKRKAGLPHRRDACRRRGDSQ